MAERIRISPRRTRPISRIRPVCLMYTPDVTPEERNIAIETLEEILDLANVRRQVPINDLGVWREDGHRNTDGELVPHRSVDWYVDKWFNPQRGQVDMNSAIRQLLFDPEIYEHPHYDVILTAKDLYTNDTNFVVGIAYSGRGTIISVNRFRQVPDKKMQRETKKQEIYHEIGHVFGLPNEHRGFAIDYSLGAHCTNICAMRQGLKVPSQWIDFVEDRKRTDRVYCLSCHRELRDYFNPR